MAIPLVVQVFGFLGLMAAGSVYENRKREEHARWELLLRPPGDGPYPHEIQLRKEYPIAWAPPENCIAVPDAETLEFWDRNVYRSVRKEPQLVTVCADANDFIEGTIEFMPQGQEGRGVFARPRGVRYPPKPFRIMDALGQRSWQDVAALIIQGEE